MTVRTVGRQTEAADPESSRGPRELAGWLRSLQGLGIDPFGSVTLTAAELDEVVRALEEAARTRA